MANQNYTILLVFAALAIAIVIAVVVSQKESFTTNYLKNIAVGNEPATNQVFAMPSYYASLDPRSENQGVSGLRGGGSAPREMMPFSTSGGSMYTAEEMINMGGCADMCDESCPKSSTGYAFLSKDSNDKNSLVRNYLSSLSEEDREKLINKIDNSLPENERFNFRKVEPSKKASYQYIDPEWMVYARKFNPTRDQWDCMFNIFAWQGEVGFSQVDTCLGRGGPEWWERAWNWLMNHPSEYIPPSRGGGSYRAAGNQNEMNGNSLSKDADITKALNAFKSSGVDMVIQGGIGFEDSEQTKSIWRKFVDWIRNNAPDYTPPSRGGGSYRSGGGHAIKGMDDEEVKKSDPSLWNKFLNFLRENASVYTPPSRGGGNYRAGPGVDATNWKDFKATEQKFGRFSSYQNAVKAEDLLPKPDIAANVDPSQYIVYDRNMGSMMMKSGNRTPVDYIRGDVIPVTSNHTPTISARINDPDSPMFVPRFGSDIGTLQRGYFTNYNDVVQVLEERNASYFMSKAQKDRMDLKANSGMA